MRTFAPGLTAAALLALGTAASAQTFVGSWNLANINGGYSDPANPWLWSNNPQVNLSL